MKRDKPNLANQFGHHCLYYVGSEFWAAVVRTGSLAGKTQDDCPAPQPELLLWLGFQEMIARIKLGCIQSVAKL